MLQDLRTITDEANSPFGLKDLLISAHRVFRNVIGFSPSFRLARNSDAKNLLFFIRAVRAEYGVYVPCELEGDLMDIERCYNRRGGFILLVEESARILATFAFVPLSDEVGELRKVYLAKEFRGFGFGTKMIFLTLRYALDLGIRTLRAETNIRLPGYRLFLKTGFTVVGRSAEYGHSFLPADGFIMERPTRGSK